MGRAFAPTTERISMKLSDLMRQHQQLHPGELRGVRQVPGGARAQAELDQREALRAFVPGDLRHEDEGPARALPARREPMTRFDRPRKERSSASGDFVR